MEIVFTLTAVKKRHRDDMVDDTEEKNSKRQHTVDDTETMKIKTDLY